MYFLADDLVEVRIDGECSILNMNGEPISSQKYSGVSKFDNGIASVETTEGSFFINKRGVIDKSGTVVVDFQFDDIRSFHNGYAAVLNNGKWSFINKSGKLITACQFDEVRDFSEGFVGVMKDGKWGFVDESGKTAIELKYDAAGNFSEGKAAVKLEQYGNMSSVWAYIDQSDNVVIDFYQYAAAGGSLLIVGDFEGGLAFVSKTFISIIDEAGANVFLGDSEFFISFAKYYKEFDAIPGYIYIDSAMKIKKYGLVGLDGKQRLEPVFDYIYGIHGDYVVVGKTVDGEGLMGVIKVT